MLSRALLMKIHSQVDGFPDAWTPNSDSSVLIQDAMPWLLQTLRSARHRYKARFMAAKGDHHPTCGACPFHQSHGSYLVSTNCARCVFAPRFT
jgi:hypothetical protein